MESSTRCPFLDEYGQPLPDRIQQVLGELVPRFRWKFSRIRDEVVVVEIFEQAGQQIMRHEAQRGTIENLHGFAWVALRRVAISMLRRSRHLLESSMIGSAESAAVLARLTAEEGSAEAIERRIFLRQVLRQISERERQIAIWKKTGFSSRWIAAKLQMSVSAVDTTYSRLRVKLQNLFRPASGPDR
jgi:RNA polymerase sigma factor (sigma-70 family)